MVYFWSFPFSIFGPLLTTGNKLRKAELPGRGQYCTNLGVNPVRATSTTCSQMYKRCYFSLKCEMPYLSEWGLLVSFEYYPYLLLLNKNHLEKKKQWESFFIFSLDSEGSQNPSSALQDPALKEALPGATGTRFRVQMTFSCVGHLKLWFCEPTSLQYIQLKKIRPCIPWACCPLQAHWDHSPQLTLT